MEQEKIANLIKRIRKENNLTQKQLAEKYNVTYQAVSKWENGINLPDTSLLKQMSKDFNISMDDIFNGKFNKKKNKIYIVFTILIIIILIISLIILKINSNKNLNFEFKTIKANCSNFKITGSIAYNSAKSSIYISNINYCGKDTTEKYSKINCTLYEKSNNVKKEIDSCHYNKENKISLEEFLKQVSFNIDNYSKVCKTYSQESLYLEIEASNNTEKTITYKIPLKLADNCN